MEEIGSKLWNTDDVGAAYGVNDTRYHALILEQYKLYVEMADRISARRASSNTFFLTLNTSAITALGVLWSSSGQVHQLWWVVIPILALLVQCVAWFYLVRSYRQLNSAKYRVIGALEERLPASPYWKAEWSVLGEGADRSRYWPLTHLEQWLPVSFGLMYVALSLAVSLS